MARYDVSTGALVLNLGEYPFHQGSLGVIRSLGSVGIPVAEVTRNPFLLPSGASRYVKRRFVWKPDGRNGERFVDGMAKIGDKLDRPTVLVPTDDLSAILIAEHAEALSSKFIFAQPPAQLPRTLANKRSLYELCLQLEIPCPRTVFPASHAEWADIAGQIRLPVVVKVNEPWSAPKGVKSTTVISDREELENYCDHPEGQIPATSLMIQEMRCPSFGTN